MTLVKRAPETVPPEEAEEQPRQISLKVGLAFAAACVIVLGALTVPGGTIGHALQRALGFGLGQAADVLAVVLGAFAVASFRTRFSPPYHMRVDEALGWISAFLVSTFILQAIGGNPAPSWDVSRGGGWLGQAIWNTLVPALGGAGAAALAGLVGAFAAIVLLDLSADDLWSGALAISRLISGGACWTFAQLAGQRPVRAPQMAPAPSTEPADLIWEPLPPPTSHVEPGPVAPPPPAASHDPARGPEWRLPSVTALKAGSFGELSQADLTAKIETIEQTLADFDVYARVVQVNPGPTVTQFGLEPGFREKRDRHDKVVKREKIKVSEITSLSNDLALALAAPSLRIEAPVPGRQVVGIEVPNGQAALVTLRQIVESTPFQKLRAKTRLAIALGEDVSGQPVAADLAKMPHLLIAGATGSGKSICLNAIIAGLLLQATPAEVRLILVDPKRVEMTTYNEVPHLLRPVVVEVDKVVSVLKWVVHEMDERYKQFEARGVRNIEGFNKLAANRSELQPLPFIVVVIDELADLMMLAPDDTERLLCRLAQLARATGIHLVVATQRPSVDVITGLIKANFPTRISFAVTSQIDSRTILDSVGAEKLLGRGDMLFLPTDAAKPVRLQGVFVSDEEIEGLVNHWRGFGPPTYVDQLVHPPTDDEEDEVDELYEKAAELAREHTRISTSLLQRRLRIGYTRAARLIDLLEQHDVVGPPEGGGRSREVHHDEFGSAE